MRPHGGRSERQGVISDSGGGRPFWGAVEGDWAQERSVQKVPSATARVRRAGHMVHFPDVWSVAAGLGLQHFGN